MVKQLEMIIFDLDGTLWETTDLTYKSANEIMKKHNISHKITRETIENTMGCTFTEAAKNYMPNLDENTRITLMREINALNSKNLSEEGGKLYPNLEKVLAELKKNYKLAIVSNCGEGYIEAFLESSGLEKYFDDFLAASKAKLPKGEAIKKVMQRNNITNAIYVGDTLKDYEASKIAGIEFIHARYGFGKEIDCKFFINAIDELLELFGKPVGEPFGDRF